MLFQTENASLKLDIVNYEFPSGGVGSGNQNWLMLRCTWIEDSHVRKDSNSCLLTSELRELTAGLKILNAGIRDVYQSDFTEPYFTLTAWANGEDFLANVSFYLPNTMDGDDTAELEGVCLTKADMKALIGELDKLCAKFPDR